MKNYWPAGQPNKGHEVLLLLADEHIDPALIRGLHARHPGLSILRVQDIGRRSADDRDLLAWAAGENRLFITHDRNTVPAFAYDRIRAGQPMPGVFILNDRLPLGQAIEELLLLALCSKKTNGATKWCIFQCKNPRAAKNQAWPQTNGQKKDPNSLALSPL